MGVLRTELHVDGVDDPVGEVLKAFDVRRELVFKDAKADGGVLDKNNSYRRRYSAMASRELA